MVIKETTENRKKVFLQNLQQIYNAMTELNKIGVSNKEVSRFLRGIVKEKVIFKGKFYYDPAKKRFVHKSNYPKYFEYFEQYIHLAKRRDERLSSEKNVKIIKKNDENEISEEKVTTGNRRVINNKTVKLKNKTNKDT